MANGILDFFGNVAQGVGDVVGGVGEHLGTGFSAVRDAERAKLAQPGIRNQIQQALLKDKTLQNAMNKLVLERQQGGGETREQKLDRKLKEAELLQTYQELSELSDDEDFQASLNAEMRALLGSGTDEPGEVGDIDTALKSAGGLAALPKTGTSRKSSRGAQADIATSADNLRQQPPRLEQIGQAFVGSGSEGRTDLRKFFEGGDEFDGIERPSEAAKPLTDFAQVSTPLSPISTVPKTHAELGITNKADIQQFDAIQSKLPDIDMRQMFQLDPAGFQKMLAALRSGKGPNGKPFTIKDAIALIQASQ